MKNVNKSKQKEGKIKKKPITKPKKEKVLIVAQEIKFARLLSGNEKKTRDRVLKSLKKWLLSCFEKKHQFKEEDFLRVWKGLFYAVWMSDKPLVQEELCDSIAGLLDVFPAEHVADAMLMMRAGLRTLATEWFGIDQHRMDKFLMLVRRWFRGSLRAVRRAEWSEHACQLFADALQADQGLLSCETPVYARNALSLIVHVTECYIEELAKVCVGSVGGESVALVVSPLVAGLLARPELAAACRRALTLLARHAPAARREEERRRAWEQMGCPAGGPDALELVSDEEQDSSDDDQGNDDDEERVLDPRAGRVHVWLRPLCVERAARHVVSALRRVLPRASSTARRRVNTCILRFEKIAANENPLPVSLPTSLASKPRAGLARKQADKLHQLERKLIADSDELALRGLSRKHRKRLLSRSRAGHNIAAELADSPTLADKSTHRQAARRTQHNTDKNSTDGAWQVEDAEPPNKKKKPKQDSSNKENVIKEKKVKKQKKPADVQTNNKAKDNVNNVKSKKNKVTEEKTLKKKTETKEKSTEKNSLKLVFDTPVVAPKLNKAGKTDKPKQPVFVVNKTKNFQKKTSQKTEKEPKKPVASDNIGFSTPKKVKFVLKNNSMQGTMDYYRSIKQSPSIPFDGSKRPSKTNLKPFTPSPINPFKKKMLLRTKSFS